MRILNLLVAAGLVLPQATSAQSQGSKTYWRVPSALGGAMAGAGVGYAFDIMRWNASGCFFCGPSLELTQAGIALGGTFGFLGGLAADRRLARGDSLSTGARRWLRLSAFLAPAAIGSSAAFLIINPSDEGECVPDGSGSCFYAEKKKIADDGTVAFLGIGGGIFAGWILQEKTKGALRPRVTAGTGSLGMSFSYAF